MTPDGYRATTRLGAHETVLMSFKIRKENELFDQGKYFNMEHSIIHRYTDAVMK